MNNYDLKSIMDYNLGIDNLQMAKLMDISPAKLELFLSGEANLDGDSVLKIYELKEKFSIPRIGSQTVKEILNNPGLTIEDKAESISHFDYDCACRETDGIVNRSKLMKVDKIIQNINNRIKEGL